MVSGTCQRPMPTSWPSLPVAATASGSRSTGPLSCGGDVIGRFALPPRQPGDSRLLRRDPTSISRSKPTDKRGCTGLLQARQNGLEVGRSRIEPGDNGDHLAPAAFLAADASRLVLRQQYSPRLVTRATALLPRLFTDLAGHGALERCSVEQTKHGEHATRVGQPPPSALAATDPSPDAIGGIRRTVAEA